jgi:hypothetical protein
MPVAGSVGRRIGDGKRIGAATKKFVGTEGNPETFSDTPSRVGGGGATRNNSVFDGFADKKKVRAEFIVALG